VGPRLVPPPPPPKGSPPPPVPESAVVPPRYPSRRRNCPVRPELPFPPEPRGCPAPPWVCPLPPPPPPRSPCRSRGLGRVRNAMPFRPLHCRLIPRESVVPPGLPLVPCVRLRAGRLSPTGFPSTKTQQPLRDLPPTLVPPPPRNPPFCAPWIVPREPCAFPPPSPGPLGNGRQIDGSPLNKGGSCFFPPDIESSPTRIAGGPRPSGGLLASGSAGRGGRPIPPEKLNFREESPTSPRLRGTPPAPLQRKEGLKQFKLPPWPSADAGWGNTPPSFFFFPLGTVAPPRSLLGAPPPGQPWPGGPSRTVSPLFFPADPPLPRLANRTLGPARAAFDPLCCENTRPGSLRSRPAGRRKRLPQSPPCPGPPLPPRTPEIPGSGECSAPRFPPTPRAPPPPRCRGFSPKCNAPAPTLCPQAPSSCVRVFNHMPGKNVQPVAPGGCEKPRFPPPPPVGGGRCGSGGKNRYGGDRSPPPPPPPGRPGSGKPPVLLTNPFKAKSRR